MDEIRAVRTVWQLLVALSRSQKWGQKPAPKTGRQYYRKKERLPKWRPHFWDQGVAYTVSPPLRAVSSGDFGTFLLFSCQLAWQSLIQVSHWGPTIKTSFFMCGCGPKSGPWWQHRSSTSRLTAKRTLHYLTVRKPIATDYGKTLATFCVLWQCGHNTALKLASQLLVVY